MESPESWFEDFGVARLVRGRAKVKLASDFVATIKPGDYHIFLTPYGACNGLYVAATTAKRFTVREQNGGRSTVKFSYRIVAKRKDISAKRMAKVKVPKFTPPKPPKSIRARRRKPVREPRLSAAIRPPKSPRLPRGKALR
jgi:hypothetical protein